MSKVETGLACGRNYLSVNGFVVAVEGDLCRDAELPGTHWNKKLLEAVAKGKAPKSKKVTPDRLTTLPEHDAEAKYVALKQAERDEHDDFVARHLRHTFAAVEATSNEQHMLWRDWAVENTYRVRDPNDKRTLVHWEQIGRGFIETLGIIRIGKDEMPVAMSGFWARLRVKSEDAGRLVLFWHLCSMVTDSRMAERFLKENLPKGFKSTDAGNFHIVVHALADES